MRGIESLIDVLDGQGLVDRNRVGLTGWSYTCWLVQYFLTHSEYPLGAAIAADGLDYSYLQYLVTANQSYIASEEPYQGSPWEKRDAWIADSPGFNLPRIRTPLRLETEGSASNGWEFYAGLTILHKPAEFVIIPDASHSAARPWHRLTSQGGAVDWYRFWLKREEDPDPAKAAQYVRWREMRESQASTTK